MEEKSWDGSTEMQRENEPKPISDSEDKSHQSSSHRMAGRVSWGKKIRMIETEICAAYYFYYFTN